MGLIFHKGQPGKENLKFTCIFIVECILNFKDKNFTHNLITKSTKFILCPLKIIMYTGIERQLKSGHVMFWESIMMSIGKALQACYNALPN